MCRLVAYLGAELALDSLLFRASSSLTRQVYDPALQEFLNLAGLGFVAWNNASARPELPFTYRTDALPMYDRNLKALAEKITANCALAHIRATAYDANSQSLVSHSNLHPFRFHGSRVVMAHNGALAEFDKMKFDVAAVCRPEYANAVEGTTDSEWIYALLMTQLGDGRREHTTAELAGAALQTLKILRDIRARHNIKSHSAVNVVITNGRGLVATRFAFDHGRYRGRITQAMLSPLLHGLWFSAGSRFEEGDDDWAMAQAEDGGAASFVLASEPLARDVSRWVEVQEYSLLEIERVDGIIRMRATDIDIN